MKDTHGSAGPLVGLRVVEFASIGPGPYCAMLLGDLGAEVVRFERPGGNGWPNPIVDRGRWTTAVDLKDAKDLELVASAVEKADVLIEGFRPGVMERLGLGPDPLLARNPRLVYARVTGWGQTGALARSAGHDINFVALSGALAALRSPAGLPVPPLNLVGDLAGGALFLAFGIMAALWERHSSGKGQVVDAAIVDGVSSMMSMFAARPDGATMNLEQDRSLLGGAAPFYRCYRCADGRHIAFGPLEPKFYRRALERIGAPTELAEQQYDVSNWAERSAVLAGLFATRTRQEWCELLEGTDACFAPVLSVDESQSHPHMLGREAYVEVGGLVQPTPAPRFSRTPASIPDPGAAVDLLVKWGVTRS